MMNPFSEKYAPKTLALAKQFGYLFLDEVELLVKTTLSLPPDPLIVNIGAGAGTSGLCFIESRADSRLHTIDIEAGNVPTGSLLGETHAFQRAGFGNTGRHWQHHAPSHVMPPWFIQRDLHPDLVFVDGDHAYESCLQDLNDWWPLLSPNGYLLVHDYGEQFWSAVMDAVAEFIKQHVWEVARKDLAGTLLVLQKVEKKEVVAMTPEKLPTQPRKDKKWASKKKS